MLLFYKIISAVCKALFNGDTNTMSIIFLYCSPPFFFFTVYD